jgi:FkbM family methyltransferase
MLLNRLVCRIKESLRLGFLAKQADAFLVMKERCRVLHPTIFDVGAHKGETAKVFKALFKTTSLHCFEPNPAPFKELADHFQGDPLVKLNNYALASDCGNAPFYSNSFTATSSIFPVIEDSASLVWDRTLLTLESVLEIKKITLDSYAKENRISTIDILKIDVQGSEYLVLRGGADLLRRRSIKILYFEYLNTETYRHQENLAFYLEYLKELNYELYGVYNQCYRRDRLAQFDLMFVPKI